MGADLLWPVCGALLALPACGPSATHTSPSVVPVGPPPLAAPSTPAGVDVGLELAARPAVPEGLRIDGDVSEWSVSAGAGSRVAVALDPSGLVIAGRLAPGITSMTLEVSSKPPRLPEVGFRQDWGVEELNCRLSPPTGRPWAPGECEGHAAAREAFVAAYEEMFRARYVIGRSGVTRSGETLDVEVRWRDVDGSRSFEVTVPPRALPEVAQAPVTKLALEGLVTEGERMGPRQTATLAPVPAVSFEPHGATRASVFRLAASQYAATPMSYRPGGGLEAHAVEHERGPEPRALVLREVALHGPLLDLRTEQVAAVHAGVPTLGSFSGGVLVDVLRHDAAVLPLASGPTARGGGVHVAIWTRVAGPGGCAATTLRVIDLAGQGPSPARAPAKQLADLPPPAGTPPACWSSRDTWANAEGTVFKSAELRVDPVTHRLAARHVVWTYTPRVGRYLRTVEVIAAP